MLFLVKTPYLPKNLGMRECTGISVWRRADEKFKENCLKTKTKYHRSFMVWSCMTSQGMRKLYVALQTINSEVQY